jgi:hypothetical protein
MNIRSAAAAAAMVWCLGTSAHAGLFGPGPGDFETVYYQPKVLASVDEALAVFTRLSKYYTAGYSRDRMIVDLQLSPAEMRFKHVRSWVESGYNWVPYNSGAWLGGHYVPIIGGSSEPWEEERFQEGAATIVFDKILLCAVEHSEGATDDSYPWRAAITTKEGNKSMAHWFGTNDRETAQHLADAFYTLSIAAMPADYTLFPLLGVDTKSKDDAAAILKRAKLPEDASGLGAVIGAVTAASPAAQAGLKSDDIVYRVIRRDGTAFDVKGTSWVNLESAVDHAAALEPSPALILKVVRDGKPIDLTVAVENPNPAFKLLRENMAKAAAAKEAAAKAAAAPPPFRLGISGRDLTADEIGKAGIAGGIFVGGVDSGSPAEQMGVKPGDYLLEIDGTALGNTAAMRQRLAAGAVARLKVWRAGKILELTGLEKM